LRGRALAKGGVGGGGLLLAQDKVGPQPGQRLAAQGRPLGGPGRSADSLTSCGQGGKTGSVIPVTGSQVVRQFGIADEGILLETHGCGVAFLERLTAQPGELTGLGGTLRLVFAG
jgi:hypothetical protein